MKLNDATARIGSLCYMLQRNVVHVAIEQYTTDAWEIVHQEISINLMGISGLHSQVERSC